MSSELTERDVADVEETSLRQQVAVVDPDQVAEPLQEGDEVVEAAREL